MSGRLRRDRRHGVGGRHCEAWNGTGAYTYDRIGRGTLPRTCSAYGAAASLVVVLLWVYYSAQILLFGAEFTKVWARRRGASAVSTEAD